MKLNRVLVASLLFMMVGTAVELYLLDHYEDVYQLIPLTCIGALLAAVVALLYWKTSRLMLVFKVLLVLTALSGAYGTFLHLQANYEFELEMKPTANQLDLFFESFSGALPALAPASMIGLALVGYSYLLLLKQKP